LKELVHSADVQFQLPLLRDDFKSVTGKPFAHFFCPMLHEDQPAELCMGHVINSACPDSFRGRVVQRKDVDGWYGAVFEAEFTTNVLVRAMGIEKAMQDPSVRKKATVRILVGEEELEYYEDNGIDVPGHTLMAIHFGQGDPVLLRIKKSKEELDTLRAKGIQPTFVIGKDARIPAFVTLVKMAYLSLFRLLGYSYALNPDGKRIGHDLLGNFFRKHETQTVQEARKAATNFFRPYLNMMRMVSGFTGKGTDPVGTVEDRLLSACVAPNKTIFALSVYIRTADQHYSVLLPYYDNPEGEVTFNKFIENENQALTVHKCQIKNKEILIEEQSTVLFWPKNSDEFNFD